MVSLRMRSRMEKIARNAALLASLAALCGSQAHVCRYEVVTSASRSCEGGFRCKTGCSSRECACGAVSEKVTCVSSCVADAACRP